MANSITHAETSKLYGSNMPSAFEKPLFPNRKREKVRKDARNLFENLTDSMNEEDFHAAAHKITKIPDLLRDAQNNEMKDACVALNELALGGLKSPNDKIRRASISATQKIADKSYEPRIAERNIKELSLVSCTETDEENQRSIFFSDKSMFLDVSERLYRFYSICTSNDSYSKHSLINITNGTIIAPTLMIMGNYKPTDCDNQMHKLRALDKLSKNEGALEHAKEKITAVAFKERAELLTSEHQAVRQTAHEHIAQSYLVCDDPKMKQTMAVTLVEAMQKEESINAFKLARGNITTILTESGKKNETMTEDDLFLMNGLFDLSKTQFKSHDAIGPFYPVENITNTEDIQDTWLADFANKANISLREMALRDDKAQDKFSFMYAVKSLFILAADQRVAEVTQGSVVKSIANFSTYEIFYSNNEYKNAAGNNLRTALSSSEVAAPYLDFSLLKKGGAFEYQPDPKQSAINDAHLKVMQKAGKDVTMDIAMFLENKINTFNIEDRNMSELVKDPEFVWYQTAYTSVAEKLDKVS
jgi:hypothetical protein